MSKSVRYSINGQYFADFGVSVIRSEGFGALKRKPVTKFEWPEYHGVSLDLEKPRFEERVIRLECNIIAENWELLYQNFQRMMAELQKAGTQRLLVEPFGFKALVYEVFMPDEAELDKRFVPGKSGAKFRLQLVEPNPIKKILYLTSGKLDLSYKCPSETEIYYGDGTRDVAVGDVVVAGRAVGLAVRSNYGFERRNYFVGNRNPRLWGANAVGTADSVELYPTWNGRGETIVVTAAAGKKPDVYCAQPLKLQIGKSYTLSFWVGQLSDNVPSTTIEAVVMGTFAFRKEISYFNYQKLTATFTVTSLDFPYLIIRSLGSQNLYFTEIQITEGAQEQPFSLAPEEQRYIIIAGNVEEITNLKTNATALWERL